jgi:hypothetical protein
MVPQAGWKPTIPGSDSNRTYVMIKNPASAEAPFVGAKRNKTVAPVSRQSHDTDAVELWSLPVFTRACMEGRQSIRRFIRTRVTSRLRQSELVCQYGNSENYATVLCMSAFVGGNLPHARSLPTCCPRAPKPKRLLCLQINVLGVYGVSLDH